MGEVTTWQMTEEERLAYIAKNPILKTNKPKRSSSVAYIDWEWRPKKANAASRKK